MNSKKSIINFLLKVGLAIIVGLFCYPVLFLLVGSFMSNGELIENLGAVLENGTGYASWSVLPFEPTLRHYVKVFFDSPEYFIMFWNSAKIVFGTLLGQCLVAIPAAWGFTFFKFKFKKELFFLYIILMMMPFQVTMLSNYIILGHLNLLDTLWALILPGVFSTFPVFIIFNCFREIPLSMIEAARIDGARERDVFLWIGIPLGKSGIISAIVLGFLEYWNLIEQPMTFLNDKTKWPLSLFLPDISVNNAGFAFAVSVITLVPAILVFFAGHDYLEQGIASLGVKE